MAGIEVKKPNKKLKGTDYSSEIPFEKPIPVGRFEVDQSETPQVDEYQSNVSLKEMEQKRRDDAEKKSRALDKKRMKKLKEKNLPKALEAINKANYQSEEIVLGQLNTKLTLS